MSASVLPPQSKKDSGITQVSPFEYRKGLEKEQAMNDSKSELMALGGQVESWEKNSQAMYAEILKNSYQHPFDFIDMNGTWDGRKWDDNYPLLGEDVKDTFKRFSDRMRNSRPESSTFEKTIGYEDWSTFMKEEWGKKFPLNQLPLGRIDTSDIHDQKAQISLNESKIDKAVNPEDVKIVAKDFMESFCAVDKAINEKFGMYGITAANLTPEMEKLYLFEIPKLRGVLENPDTTTEQAKKAFVIFMTSTEKALDGYPKALTERVMKEKTKRGEVWDPSSFANDMSDVGKNILTYYGRVMGLTYMVIFTRWLLKGSGKGGFKEHLLGGVFPNPFYAANYLILAAAIPGAGGVAVSGVKTVGHTAREGAKLVGNSIKGTYLAASNLLRGDLDDVLPAVGAGFSNGRAMDKLTTGKILEPKELADFVRYDDFVGKGTGDKHVADALRMIQDGGDLSAYIVPIIKNSEGKSVTYRERLLNFCYYTEKEGKYLSKPPKKAGKYTKLEVEKFIYSQVYTVAKTALRAEHVKKGKPESTFDFRALVQTRKAEYDLQYKRGLCVMKEKGLAAGQQYMADNFVDNQLDYNEIRNTVRHREFFSKGGLFKQLLKDGPLGILLFGFVALNGLILAANKVGSVLGWGVGGFKNVLNKNKQPKKLELDKVNTSMASKIHDVFYNKPHNLPHNKPIAKDPSDPVEGKTIFNALKGANIFSSTLNTQLEKGTSLSDKKYKVKDFSHLQELFKQVSPKKRLKLPLPGRPRMENYPTKRQIRDSFLNDLEEIEKNDSSIKNKVAGKERNIIAGKDKFDALREKLLNKKKEESVSFSVNLRLEDKKLDIDNVQMTFLKKAKIGSFDDKKMTMLIDAAPYGSKKASFFFDDTGALKMKFMPLDRATKSKIIDNRFFQKFKMNKVYSVTDLKTS